VTRLSNEEIATHKSWLCVWRTAQEMENYVSGINDHMGSDDFFNQPGIAFLRDAWSAAQLARVRNAKVRLVATEWPDFELKTDSRIEQFECVEADVAGRRRGEEYRNADPSKTYFDPVENWIARAEAIPPALQKAIEKKIGKRYGSKANLLVYLNISEFGIRQAEIETSFAEIAKKGKDHFTSICILWKNKAYCF
jgi:hypothetical protein